MRNIKDFQARYDRWKNGERYWDIRGIDLPQYDTGDKNTNVENPQYYYNVYPSAIGAKNLEVTIPDIVVTPNYLINEKTLDQKAQEEREFQANHPFLANVVKNTKEISEGWDNFWENNLFRYPAMVATGGILGKGIQKLGRMKKAADLIKLRKDTAHLGPGYYRNVARKIGPDIHDQLINDVLDMYGKFQQTPIGALLPFNNGKEGNSIKINLPEYYTGKGGPSQSIRKYIASAEGQHFAGQNRRWGGDAVGTFYKRLGNIIGNDTWNALTQNQRDALTSYYYNIKPSSFNPTLSAIRQWATNGMKHDDLSAIRDTINVGMNNKKLSGLRKRRLYEQDLFMKDIQPTGVINGNIVQQVPSNNIQIPMNPEFNINTITVPIQPDIRSILNPRINIPLKPELYPDQKPDGSFNHGKSGIYINPANRGKFNATKKRTGKTTEELSHSKNPLTRKRAQFALNARKWKH